jgi:hypothetical protein
LEPSQPRQGVSAGKKGGQAAGPNPTDKGKPGSKRHLVVDRQGVPLAIQLTAAKVHDSLVFESLSDGIPSIQRPEAGLASGRRNCTPTKAMPIGSAGRR